MLAQIIVGSLAAGAVYALIALGFVLLHNGTGVVHFGYGDQVTFGAYLVLIMQTFFGMPFSLSIAAALVGSAALGSLIYFLFMLPLRNASLLTRLIATLAIGTLIREWLRAFMGPNAWPFPFLLPSTPIEFAGVILIPSSLAIAAVVAVVLLVLFLFFNRTLSGKAVLAACENRRGASMVGIRVSRVFLAVWIVASILATVAGILVAPLLTLSPDMGLIAIKGFAAAVLGGFHSLAGAVVGGLLLGILEGLAGAYVSTALKDMISYGLLIAFILVRPQGLLGGLAARKV